MTNSTEIKSVQDKAVLPTTFDLKSILVIKKFNKKDGSGTTYILDVNRDNKFNRLMIQKLKNAGVAFQDYTLSQMEIE